ncbi:MAG: helix-turn-helix domain-containing protein [Gemmatimonadales bacterium]
MLKQRREDKGWTQRDLAKHAKVTPGYVAQLEMGVRKNPSLETLKRLAKALGVPVSELLS